MRYSGRKNPGAGGAIGIILMTYGSATTADHVKEYFTNIYGGKASPALIADFENRYRLVGGSPLIRITTEQAELLEKELNASAIDVAEKYVVRCGMRHSAPKIADVVAELRAAGAERLAGIVLSPQFSSIIMEGYRTAFLKAAKEHGYADGDAVIAGPWPTEPHFIQLTAERVKKSLESLRKKYGEAARTPVIFTTHSLPESVVAKDPGYLLQLKSTIDEVVSKLKRDKVIADGQWHAGYQSAGHTPEAWLKPDLTDILDVIVKEKEAAPETVAPAVLLVPIQFLADHLEILYDLDIAAKGQCAERGFEYNRIELPNTDPLFIKSLAAVSAAISFPSSDES